MIVLFIYLYILFFFRFVSYDTHNFLDVLGRRCVLRFISACEWSICARACMHLHSDWYRHRCTAAVIFFFLFFFFLVLFPRIVYHYAFYIAHCVHRIYEPCAGASIAYITHCQKGSMRKRMASHTFRVSPNHGPNKCVNFPLWLINWPLHCCTHFAYMSCWSIIVCA